MYNILARVLTQKFHSNQNIFKQTIAFFFKSNWVFFFAHQHLRPLTIQIQVLIFFVTAFLDYNAHTNNLPA